MGTMVGDDGGTNRIGVAPQARWMACKGCESSSCSVRALLECGDFILAPWNLNRANPDPSRRPHVVNNSWGSDGGDLWFQRMVRSWRAAGIFPAFSIGNGGPGCGTAGSPGDYVESFASGATDIYDAIAPFSARGPSFFGVRKPDVTAPGVNIRSSVPPNAYVPLSGTSMASPHTAGIVALLWSAYPGLNRDVANTEKKLRPAADILDSTERCGGNGTTTHPNNTFGWGREDAAQALAPFNVYTDRANYYPGDTMNVFVSLVNPKPVTINVDLYLVLAQPDGLLFFPSFGTTPAPWLRNLAVPPLFEVFDVKIFSHRFAGEFPGTASWLAVLTPPGADFFDPAAQLSVDRALVTKN
jgi:subtilisin family serine protease